MKERDQLFHEAWLGLAQPIEGLVFSVPVLADAQIAPAIRASLSAAFAEHVHAPDGEAARIRDLPSFLREFLGYSQPGMLVPEAELPPELSFYAAEGGQTIRPSYAIARGPFESDDPFAAFADEPAAPAPAASEAAPSASPPGAPSPYLALVWDLTPHAPAGGLLGLDQPEAETGPWRYPPTAKFERLLRHCGVPIGLLFNGAVLRLVYAPAGETTGHLSFRVEHLVEAEGRPILAALELLLSARRSYGASPEHTLEGLLRASRKRQADVTEALARQVFEAVELLVAGFEAASARDRASARTDWLGAAMEQGGEHFSQGVLSVVLRLVFLLCAEDQSLLPVEHPSYAEHLSLYSLHARLASDAGSHPESMHHRFGAYGQLLSLFRAVYYGVKHRELELPARRGRLFDPNAYPFLEGGEPGWTAALLDPEARAQARPPSLDDGTVYDVLHKLIVFEGQKLSYRALDVEQVGSVYESLMGYEVLRLGGEAVRVGKYGVWVELPWLRALSASERASYLKEACGLNPAPVKAIEEALSAAPAGRAGLEACIEALLAHAQGGKARAAANRRGPGRLVLQPGEERRRTGSHYTPRSLAEQVVARALEPLLACLGPEPKSAQLLELKVCDPAMGSGAFLVATCRALASELVAAWTREGKLAELVELHGDAHLHARRLVAQRCLYGVDKNAAAVELAKLSLWLVTLSKHLPFTFVDHALRHGDSLVGLDFAQIRAFHWSPPEQNQLCALVLGEALDQAVALRQEILALSASDDPESQAHKRRLLDFAQQAIAKVRLVADLCVGAFFAESKAAAREKERKRRLGLVEAWLAAESEAQAEQASPEQRERAYTIAAERRQALELLVEELRERHAPFHWWIELPEVFFDERPDPLDGGQVNGAALMEAVVGNPPFLGGSTISPQLGEAYLAWLFAIHVGARGKADLSCHFFRRAAHLIGEHGTLGLIATNTIAQGDTRESGLARLVDQGWQIYNAVDSMRWPGAAAVTVSVVHLAKGRSRNRVAVRLGNRAVPVINTRLGDTPERDDPKPLFPNGAASYLGSKIYGQGFILTTSERDELVARDARNAERIFPYLGGEEVNTSPTQHFDRYVINFGQMVLEEAEGWPELLSIVRRTVKAERDRLKDNADGRQYKARWWQYGRVMPALYAAIAPLARCLVTACVSKHLMFSFQPTDRIFSHKLIVFPLDRYTAFAVLQSRLHVAWTWLLSSTLETRLNYSASDCFENFPFPEPDPRAVLPGLEAAGEALYAARAQYMVETQQGLTETYNQLKDPACLDATVLALRRLHESLDRAVLEAYGWGDLEVPPYCPVNEAEAMAVKAFEGEVIDRLYQLNAARAEAERAEAELAQATAGLAAASGARQGGGAGARPAAKKAAAKKTAKKAAAKKRAGGDGQGTMF